MRFDRGHITLQRSLSQQRFVHFEVAPQGNGFLYFLLQQILVVLLGGLTGLKVLVGLHCCHVSQLERHVADLLVGLLLQIQKFKAG
jgi:hypothetical protein